MSSFNAQPMRINLQSYILGVITIARSLKLSEPVPDTGMSYRSSHGPDRVMTLASLTVGNRR